MTVQDTLNILLVIGFLTISACIVFITFFLIKALKSITSLADSLQNTTETIREKIQTRIISLIPPLIIGLVGRLFKKRG